MEFKKLFEPIVINGLEISSRTVMPAMGLAYTDRYEFNERYRAFYRERAGGGVGLMIIGPVAIDRVGSAPLMPGLFNDSFIPDFKKFNDEIHRSTGVKLGTQLFQMGRNAYSILTGMQPIAPSPVPGSMSPDMPREMTAHDISEVQTAFAAGARRAREAGFDYIEIIACTGYLISQFLSPLTNHRSDEYGGVFENRARFGLEVIREVRRTVGRDFPVGIRVAGHDYMEGGHSNRESAMFCAAAEAAGIDAINVTGGWHETNIPQLTTDVPAGAYTYLARGIKEKTGIPVFASNRLGDPMVAENALRSGACDMICWGRPLIADPELPSKVRTGRLNEIVPCIACNQGCFDSIFSGSPVCCVLNPRAGREREFAVKKARRKKTILVAGAGPAGMEFALTAASRGHNVTIYGKEPVAGGQINLAKKPPRKRDLQKIIDSMLNRISISGVKLRLGRMLTPGIVRRLRPDLLVVATGAEPLRLSVPGIDKPHVLSAWDVLSGKTCLMGKNVVVIGGSATGCETAHYIASMGAPDPETLAFLLYHRAEDPEYLAHLMHTSSRNITVIEMTARMADNVGRSARWSLLKCLRLNGVALRPDTTLLEITDDAVIINTGRVRESIPADTVIMAVGARPVRNLAEINLSGATRVIVIGDAKSPRKITDAVREGFEEALKV